MTERDKIRAEIKRLRGVIRDAVRVAKLDLDSGYYYDAGDNLMRAWRIQWTVERLEQILSDP